MEDSRRDFLKKSALLGLSGLAASFMGTNNLHAIGGENIFSGNDNKFLLPKLPYGYDALEPFIDKETMEIHHTKHHQAYIDKVNTASPTVVDFTSDPALSCAKVDAKTESLVRNNLGGHYNHSLFWTLMAPNKEKKELKPVGKLAEAINTNFKSFEDFKKEFSEKATKHFGSGWCWLVMAENKTLKIVTTPNQDNPLMPVSAERGKPVLALDVWEHAYYLKYQNKRPDYISNWWNVVNWQKADELFSSK